MQDLSLSLGGGIPRFFIPHSSIQSNLPSRFLIFRFFHHSLRVKDRRRRSFDPG